MSIMKDTYRSDAVVPPYCPSTLVLCWGARAQRGPSARAQSHARLKSLALQFMMLLRVSSFTTWMSPYDALMIEIPLRWISEIIFRVWHATITL